MKDRTNYAILGRLFQKYLRPSETLLSALAEHVIARSYEHREVFLHRDELQTRIALLTEGAAIAVKTERGQKSSCTFMPLETFLRDAPLQHYFLLTMFGYPHTQKKL